MSTSCAHSVHAQDYYCKECDLTMCNECSSSHTDGLNSHTVDYVPATPFLGGGGGRGGGGGGGRGGGRGGGKSAKEATKVTDDAIVKFIKLFCALGAKEDPDNYKVEVNMSALFLDKSAGVHSFLPQNCLTMLVKKRKAGAGGGENGGSGGGAAAAAADGIYTPQAFVNGYNDLVRRVSAEHIAESDLANAQASLKEKLKDSLPFLDVVKLSMKAFGSKRKVVASCINVEGLQWMLAKKGKEQNHTSCKQARAYGLSGCARATHSKVFL